MKVHFIDRDANEKYAVIFTGDATEPIEVYSLLDGSKKTVTYEDANAKAYVVEAGGITTEVIKSLTIADYTVVVNTTRTPALDATLGGTWYPFAICNILHGVVGTQYDLYINGSKMTYTTSTTAGTTTMTTNIASQLYNQLTAWVQTQATPADWQVVYGGSCILIYNLNYDDFTFKVEDSWGNSAMVGIKEQAAKLEDLPSRLPDDSSYPTDTFHMHSQQEYWFNFLFVETTPGSDTWTELGYAVSGYGHHDSSIWESMNYWEGLISHVLTGVNTGFGSYAITYTPQPGDQFYSTEWEYSRDASDIISVWRRDGVRSRLKTRNKWMRYNNWSDWWADDRYMTVSRHETVDFTDMAVKIYGEGTKTDFLGYYLRWKQETTDGVNATGTWVETVKGGLQNQLDGTTCPHQLVRNQNGTFTLSRISWEDRLVGDEVTAPAPSFIGNKINDVFFHKNRVGFLAAGNVIISKADAYWDFFPTTALEALDDDPIDITIPSTGVDALRWAIPNKGDLLIFGPSDEYMLTAGDQVFGAKTVSMDTNTNFPISSLAAPVTCGANVYFLSPKGDWAAVHEYFTQPNTLTNDAADVAAHCPRYVPADIAYVTASPVFNLLLMCTGADDTIYGYKYYWSGEQKAQSAWFKWTFPYTVLATSIIDNYAYVIGLTDGSEWVLEKMNLERVNTSTLPFRVHLDRQEIFDSTGVFNENTGLTTFTTNAAYTQAEAADCVLVNLETGKEVDGLTWATANTFTVLGDYSAKKMLIGTTYSQTYTFSEFGVQSGGDVKIFNPQGRLALRTLIVAFMRTAMFDLVVTPKGTAEGGRTAITHEYTGVEIGLATLGDVELPSTQKRFLIMGNADGTTIQLVNDTFYPACWYEASWEGMYTIRSRSI